MRIKLFDAKGHQSQIVIGLLGGGYDTESGKVVLLFSTDETDNAKCAVMSIPVSEARAMLSLFGSLPEVKRVNEANIGDANG